MAPLAAGIFAGAAAFDVFPMARASAGNPAFLWAAAGLGAFVAVHRFLAAFGRDRESWAGVVAMWFHSFLEGVLTAAGYVLNLALGLALSVGLVAHLVPESMALVAMLVASGLPVRRALTRTSGLVVAIAAGMLAARHLAPGLAPSLLGGALAFGSGGLLYLAAGSWRSRRTGLAGSLVAAAAGAALMWLPVAMGLGPRLP